MSSNSTAATFVTVLGWLLIVFAAFGVLTSAMQNVMVAFMFPAMDAQLSRAGQMPPAFLLAFRAFAAVVLCTAAFLLFAAWSFLKRRNWARRTFVVVFVLSAIWAGLTFLASIGIGVFDLVGGMRPSGTEFPTPFATAFRVMSIMFGIMTAGFVVLFVWLAKRLRAPDVRAEFLPQPRD